MPSPIGHALGGVICALALERGVRPAGPRGAWHERFFTPAVQLGALAAVLPDLDFAWGRHNMETHSLGAALAAGLLVLIVTRGRGVRLALIVCAAWASHVLFDWLGSDDTPPLGVMAWWPWSQAFAFAHAYVFEAISRRYWLPGFWRHNLWAVATEVAMLAPVAVAVAWWRQREGSRRRN